MFTITKKLKFQNHPFASEFVVLADKLKKESEWETVKAAIKAKLDFG